MLLTSPLLSALGGVRHGFATRLGGVSTGENASWNFGPNDEPRALTENRRRFVEALSMPNAHLVQVSQVHGARVIDAKMVAPGTEADALVDSRPGFALGVRTADCAPILMAGVDEDGRRHVASVHAGWRGAVADIPGAAVSALESRGVRPDAQRAAIGPTIGIDAFEVGDEVVQAARKALDGEAPKTSINERGRHHLDLVDLIERLLRRAGLASEHIERVGGCTFEDDRLYFSHRRDRGRTGRHLSAIAVADEAMP